jgi:HlyD family secretion protein
MSDKKRSRRIWIIAAVIVVVAGAFGWKFYQDKKSALPPGIAYGNGRIEAKLVDIAAKEPLRVKEVRVQEGDIVQPGQVVVQLDTVTLEAQMAEAMASVAAAREKLAVVNASIARRNSEIVLAQIEVDRVRNMLSDRASSQRELDVRTMHLATTSAALAEERARLESAKQDVAVAEANVATIKTRIDDATLISPIVGRVLYRLAEPGEVLAAGGKAITLVNLEDVYMEIFLPSEQAAALKIGSEGRITMDYAPNRSAVGYVTFVSPEAQFTPKEVETRSERDKLMFRVKIQIPKELVGHYVESIKTGVRGTAYVKVNDTAAWPQYLEANVLRVPKTSALGTGPMTSAQQR